MKQIPLEIKEFLDKTRISYEPHEHEAISTCEEGLRIAEKIGSVCCKSLLLRKKKRFFLFIIPGNNRFDSKSAAAYLNSGHLSFASSEDLKELMNTFPGAVSLLGLVYDKNHRIEVFIDESLLKAERIDCHPCRNDMSLVLSMNELLKKFFPSLGISYEAVPSEFLNGMKK